MIEKNNKERGTELIWQGKYKEDGTLNLPERVSWPFQTIETVNESKADREKKQKPLGFEKKDAGPWRNRLIWGDNKYIMTSLLNEFAGKINLIYIDPPFATGADFSYKVNIGSQEVTKEPSMIEEVAYRDTWGKGMDSYLQMMFERVIIMRDLLAESGSIYVHLDWHVGHYLKAVLDEIFGKEQFLREVVWSIETSSGFKSQANMWIRGHDTILIYKKGNEYIFNKQFLGLDEKTIRRYDKINELGKRYKIYYQNGKKRIVYLEQSKGRPITDVWTDIIGFQTVNRGPEYLNFPTQKPEALLERIVTASSNTGDLVADFFCGSGTTGAVAEKLGRWWIMADLSRFAIQTTRKRLLQIENCSPFVVQNLGKYERQYWYNTFGSESAEGKRKEYQETILKFYKAEPVRGYHYIHGSKGKSVVSVGELDVPVTLDQVDDIVKECIKAKQDRVDILGWEFEMGLDVEVENRNKKSPVKVRLLRIPKEVMDPRYAGKIEFYDLGALELDIRVKDRNTEIEIKSFFIPHLELVKEEEVRAKITHWQDYIDYWAIDWNYRDDTFHNEWQEFRTRQNPKLKLKASSKDSAPGEKYYIEAGKYKILVKVIDIFGNDTTRLLEVEIK
jgi:DNA modification methylase